VSHGEIEIATADPVTDHGIAQRAITLSTSSMSPTKTLDEMFY